MIIANCISYILVIIGALNWGLVGIFGWNLVESIFGGLNAGSIIVYILVAIAALWLIISPFISGGKITLWHNDMMNEEKKYASRKSINKTDE
ncbi:MAG: DUF378 domain-containing protein [Christensenellales bacterium]